MKVSLPISLPVEKKLLAAVEASEGARKMLVSTAPTLPVRPPSIVPGMPCPANMRMKWSSGSRLLARTALVISSMIRALVASVLSTTATSARR